MFFMYIIQWKDIFKPLDLKFEVIALYSYPIL